MPSIVEQLSLRGREVISNARLEAAGCGTTHVDTEHLLLGLLSGGQSRAMRILVKLNASPHRIRQALGSGSASLALQTINAGMELTAQAKHVLQLSAAEAQRMVDERITTEHILVGLLLEDGSSRPPAEATWPPAPSTKQQGLGGQTLASLGVTVDAVRAEIVNLRNEEAEREG